MVESILLRDVWLTLIKSVIFATIIVQVGYLEGCVRAAARRRWAGGDSGGGEGTFLVILADLAATQFSVMGWSAVG